MAEKSDNERLAIVETQLTGITGKTNSIENSVKELHGKFDNFSKVISENYVAKDTFEQYKKTQEQREKNRWMDRLLTIIITAVITGLIAYFLRRGGV